MVVTVIKNTFGALRPNFFAVCNPEFNKTLCPGYISNYTCTRDEDDPILTSSRQSFPSGNAMFAMYIAIYYCIHIQIRLGTRYSRLLKISIQSILVLVALLCRLGYVKNHKHQPFDALAGFILGALLAIFIHVSLGKHILVMQTKKATTSSRIDIEKEDCYNKSGIEECSALRQEIQSMFPQNDVYVGITRDSSAPKCVSFQNNNGINTNQSMAIQHNDV